jgi:hypothetical protein
MQGLEVSGAVRPLKWPLGVKWLNTLCHQDWVPLGCDDASSGEWFLKISKQPTAVVFKRPVQHHDCCQNFVIWYSSSRVRRSTGPCRLRQSCLVVLITITTFTPAPCGQNARYLSVEVYGVYTYTQCMRGC